MNRRNVLGNKIEESKTTWVVLTGVLAFLLQFLAYYLIEAEWLEILVAALITLLGCGVVHFITKEQEEVFGYLVVPCVFSGIVGLLVPYSEVPLFPSASTALCSCFFAWMIPVLYVVAVTFVLGTHGVAGFARFFRYAMSFFYVIYFGLMIYGVFFWQSKTVIETDTQWIPFATFAAFINGILNGNVVLDSMFSFLIERVVFFLPYGFFVAMAGRKLHGVIRFLLLLLLPVLVEAAHVLLGITLFDIDNVIFRFVGSMIGMLFFQGFSALFQYFTGKNVDGSEIDRDYYGRKI